MSEFTDLEAVRFLRDLTYRSLQEYCEGLQKILIDVYGSDASSVAMLEALRPILSHRLKNNFSAQYSFRTQGPHEGRHWKVRMSVTEIPFISVGTTDRESALNGIPLEFARVLVEHGLADVVDHTPLVKRQKKFGILHTGRYNRQVTFVGTLAGIYVSIKIDAILALNEKMRWEACLGNQPSFSRLRAFIEELLSENNTGEVLTVSLDAGEVPPLLAQCDKVVHAKASSQDLDRLFAPLGISLKQWLATRFG